MLMSGWSSAPKNPKTERVFVNAWKWILSATGEISATTSNRPFAIPDSEKMEQEQKPLIHIRDSFKKIIVVKDRIKRWYNENGVLIMGLEDFLLMPNSLDL